MILRDVNRTDSGALSQLINLMDSFIRSRLAVICQRQARLSNGLLCDINTRENGREVEARSI